MLFHVILLFSISLSVFNKLNKKLNKELNKLVFFCIDVVSYEKRLNNPSFFSTFTQELEKDHY